MIRKKIGTTPQTAQLAGLDLEALASFEVSSEHADHPFENVLKSGPAFWQAAEDGRQIIRLTFDHPIDISRLELLFREDNHERLQEFAVLLKTIEIPIWTEIRRQQFHFSPPGTTTEREEIRLNLRAVLAIELQITPALSGKGQAALTEFMLV